jgi:hypothetical protein
MTILWCICFGELAGKDCTIGQRAGVGEDVLFVHLLELTTLLLGRFKGVPLTREGIEMYCRWALCHTR